MAFQSASNVLPNDRQNILDKQGHYTYIRNRDKNSTTDETSSRISLSGIRNCSSTTTLVKPIASPAHLVGQGCIVGKRGQSLFRLRHIRNSDRNTSTVPVENFNGISVAGIRNRDAVLKNLFKLNRGKMSKERIAESHDDIMLRTQRLRVKMLVKRVVEKFKENVNRKKTPRKDDDEEPDNSEIISVKVTSTVDNNNIPISQARESQNRELSPSADDISQNRPEESSKSPASNESESSYRGYYLTTGYNENESIEEINEHSDSRPMGDGNKENEVRYREIRKSPSLKKTIVVTMPRLSWESKKKIRIKYNTTQEKFVGMCKTYPELYDMNTFDSIKHDLENRNIDSRETQHQQSESESSSEGNSVGKSSTVDWEWDSAVQSSLSTSKFSDSLSPAKSSIEDTQQCANDRLMYHENVTKTTVKQEMSKDVHLKTEHSAEGTRNNELGDETARNNTPQDEKEIRRQEEAIRYLKRREMREVIENTWTASPNSIPILRSENTSTRIMSIIGNAPGTDRSTNGNSEKVGTVPYKIVPRRIRPTAKSLLTKRMGRDNIIYRLNPSDDKVHGHADSAESNSQSSSERSTPTTDNFSFLCRCQTAVQHKRDKFPERRLKSEYAIRSLQLQKDAARAKSGTPLI